MTRLRLSNAANNRHTEGCASQMRANVRFEELGDGPYHWDPLGGLGSRDRAHIYIYIYTYRYIYICKYIHVIIYIYIRMYMSKLYIRKCGDI